MPTRTSWLACFPVILLLAGPADAGVEQWSHLGPFIEYVDHLALDPANPAHLVVVSNGRIFHSTDGAATWARSDFDDPIYPVNALRAAPFTFYLSTYPSTSEVLRSLDGGATWEPRSARLPEGVNGLRIAAVDPDSPSTLFAVAWRSGVLRSDDGGTTWRTANEGLGEHLSVWPLKIDPQQPSRLFLRASDSTTSGFFRSTDGGQSWVDISGLLPLSGRFLVVDVTFDVSTTPSTVYVVVRGSEENQDGIFRSAVDGNAFERLPESPPLACFDRELEFAPDRRGGVLYLRSCDGLFRWSDSSSWTRLWGIDGVRAYALEIDPDRPTTLYLATGLGLVRSEDGGETWKAVNSFAPTRVPHVAVDPRDPQRLFVSGDGRVLRSEDGGRSWDFSHPLVGTSSFLEIDPEDPSIVYFGYGGTSFPELRRSNDGGDTWITTFSFGRFSPGPLSLAVDPVRPRFVYLGTRIGLFVSKDRGQRQSWQEIGTGRFSTYVSAGVSAIVVDPATRDVYVGTRSGKVHVSNDQGASWTRISAGLTADGILSLAYDPEARVLYAGGRSPGLFQASPPGARWTLTPGLRSDVQVSEIELDPTRPERVHLVTDRGVLRSLERGEPFEPFRRESLGRGVLDLEVAAANPDLVYAATSEGLFEIETVGRPRVLNLGDGGRFRVEIEWRDLQNQVGPGTVAVVPGAERVATDLRSRDSIVLEFFQPDNWEMLVKVLDGTAINGHFWVFFAAATDVGFNVTVTDTRCGQVKRWTNPAGVAAHAVTDDEAFPSCAAPSPPQCTPGSGIFCLGEDGRFELRVESTDVRGNSSLVPLRGNPNPARQARLAGPGLARGTDSALFYFFSENNWEMLVKVLDGCDLNDRFWFFSAATTDVGFTVKVTDTATGTVKTYRNEVGVSASAITDTQAFATCSAR